MDNGFPILDAFNDDQAFERHFGSLLDDASNQLPVSVNVIGLTLMYCKLDTSQYLLSIGILERINGNYNSTV